MHTFRRLHSVVLALPLAAACDCALAADPSFDYSAAEAGSIRNHFGGNCRRGTAAP